MKLKIDLEKAYDKLEWSFIRETLIKVNMPEDLIDLIMSCVTLVSTSILFNEEALDPIYPTRGIRQGGSLSPYLFILCMDFLGQLIEEKCSKKLWQPVKASQRGPAFSHLLFANDLVFDTLAQLPKSARLRRQKKKKKKTSPLYPLMEWVKPIPFGCKILHIIHVGSQSSLV